jgi:HmuY protein
MSIYHLSISVLKVGRQLVGSLAVAAFFMPKRLIFKTLTHQTLAFQKFETFRRLATSPFVSLTVLLFLLQGCIREEDPVLPHAAGDVVSRSIALSSDYRSQVFYNLEKDSVVHQNLKTDWDVSFEVADTEGGKIYLNQAKYMFAWATDKTELEQLRDTTGFFKNQRWDAANNPDTLGIGNVKGINTAFWIDRGLNGFGDPLDFIRFKVVSISKDKYIFKILRQGAARSEQYEIQRDTHYNRVYFSFETNRAVKAEPKKTEWDLQFTQYMHTFKDPYTPYLVVGVLLNPLSTQGVADSSLTFQKIDRTVAQSLKLTNKLDVIGYGWKEFTGNNFRIKLQYNYIIQNQKSQLFKMRFVDFYDNRGTKGTPKFEFQRL